MAMPEVGIGFFPDVGGSYFLSRLPGNLGSYLALTGNQIRAADAIYCGLADLYLSPAALARLEPALDALAWGGAAEHQELLDRTIRSLATAPGDAPLAALRPAIHEHFGPVQVSRILASLEAESRPEFAEWAQATLKTLRGRSPTMLSVAAEQLQRGRDMSFADCLRMEIGMVRQSYAQGDFLEGVRALIIDKDNTPHWKPGRLEEVTREQVDAIFKNPWEGHAHPLANIEGVLPACK
jgi:enoyl-CoA hydratase/carnithine racemase